MAIDNSHSFSAYFKRAVSPLMVLSLLKERDMYGYELNSIINKRSNNKLGISVLYPVIYKLQKEGLVASNKTAVENGRNREYYEITPKGLDYVNSQLAVFNDLAKEFLNVVSPCEEE